jgi:transcription antitermination factor NusG
MRWYAVRTKPGAMRQQDSLTAVEAELRLYSIEHYLPIERITIRHHRTKKLIELRRPLCPGYVFVANVWDWGQFDQLRWVTGPIRVNNKPASIPLADIEQIQEAERLIQLASAARQPDSQVDVKRRFPPGTRIKIIGEHPLAGQNAYVRETKGRKSIKAVLNSLKALQIEVPIANAIVDS